MKNTNNTFTIRIIYLILLIGFTLIPSNVFAANTAQEYPEYIIQQGDTLDLIARRFGISLDELQSINGLTDPNSINIGQRLIIPGLEGISGLLISETIQYGTSLKTLSRQYQTNLDNLIVLNHLTSPSETITGVDFLIPIRDGVEPLLPILTLNKGNTAIEAAIFTDISPWQLMNLNQTSGTWDIIPGETLYGIYQEEDENDHFQTGVTEISFNALPFVQGETMEIHIETDAIAEISGSFAGDPLVFLSENNTDYYMFYGIHAQADTGVFPLQINVNFSNGGEQAFNQLIFLEPGGYGAEYVTNVPDEYLDADGIAGEDEFLEPILNRVTTQRFWDGQFQYPVDEPCIGSSFGLRRDYNSGNYFYYHTGMDFPICTAQNWNVYATAAGQVVVAEELFVKGNALVIDHGWGVYSIYAHLSEFNVKVGDFVQPGDLIGLIGNTGRSAGPHLHFEIDILGTPVNPETWLQQEFP